MKKIKTALAAITAFAVVGSSLAFKAEKFSTFSYFASTSSGTRNCSTTISHWDLGIGPGDVLIYTSTVSGGDCLVLTALQPE